MLRKIWLGLLVSMLFFTLIPQNTAHATEISGKLENGFHFTEQGSPYEISTTLMIDKGSTVFIDAGVTLIMPYNQPLFWNFGSLISAGTKDKKVKFIGSKSSLMKLVNAPRGVVFEASNTIFDKVGAIFDGNPLDGESVKINIADSEFIGTLVNAWYPSGFDLSRNVFSGGGGISIGYTNGSLPKGLANINNNLFVGDGSVYPFGSSASIPGGLWINCWSSYGQPVHVHRNTFRNLSRPAINSSVDGVIDASQNYWGTTVQQSIQNYVLDKNDSFDWRNVINVDSPLEKEDERTPKVISYAPDAGNSPLTPLVGNAVKGVVAKSAFYLQTGGVARIPVTFFTNSNAPATSNAVRVVASYSGKEADETNLGSITDSQGIFQVLVLSTSTDSGKVISYKVAAGKAIVNFDVYLGSTSGKIQAIGKKVSIEANFAAGKTLTITDNGKRLISRVVASNEPQIQQFSLKAGVHKIQLRISGGVFIEKVLRIAR